MAFFFKGLARGSIGYRFPVKNSAISRYLLKTSDFPDSEFSASSSRRVFFSRLKALFKAVAIEQLLKMIVS